MRTIFTLLAVACQAFSAPKVDLVLHEKRSDPNLSVRKRVDGDAILPLHIALAQSKVEDGYDHLLDISNPQSEAYGRHWTTEEIHAKFAPSDAATEGVLSWLHEHGHVREHVASSASNGWLALDMSVREAERLLATEYYEQENGDGSVVIVCDEYYLPAHLSSHIDYISPGVMASPSMKKVNAKRTIPFHLSAHGRRSAGGPPDVSPGDTSTCGQWITPDCLKAMYGIPDTTLNQPENALGVYAFGDVYDQEDLDLYFSHYAPWVPNGTHPNLTSINGAMAPVRTSNGGVESILDFDLSLALLYPQEVVVYQTLSTRSQQQVWINEYGPGSNTTIVGVFLPFVAALDGQLCTERERKSGADCGVVELTNVLSVSYGQSELQTPERAARRICAEFMKLALKGHTILAASQDEGVAQRPPVRLDPSLPWTNGCINPKHIDNTTINGTVFNPTFPASCPFVTAVGATQLDPDQSVGDPERAMNIHDSDVSPLPNLYSISSGGGVSNYFPVPEYQKCAADEYFSAHAPDYRTYEYTGRDSVGSNGGIHARAGRGIPDLAANGAHMPQFWKGKVYPTQQAGTSLSTPIVASMITMINQQRTLVGKGPVGFINPVIYQHPEAFTDITRGVNPGCGTEGFPATKGWDASTGLGTPIYPKLLEVFMNLP